MDTKIDLIPEVSDKIVYVRPISFDTLPEEMRQRMGAQKIVYSVHNTEGERLALVSDRNLAFALARQHDFAPVNVH